MIARRCANTVAALTVFAHGAMAEPAERLSLADAHAMATENSPALRAMTEKSLAASARAGEARSVRLPAVSLSARYARLSDIPTPTVSIPTPTGTQNVTISPVVLNQYGVTASVAAPLFTGYRMRNAERASMANALAARRDIDATESDVALAVERTYWRTYSAREAAETIRNSVHLIEAYRRDVERRRDAGVSTQDDVLEVDVRLSEARLRLVEAEHAADVAEATLANVVGRPLGTRFELRDHPDESDRPTPSLDSLVHDALAHRAELAATEKRIDALRIVAEAARGENLPNVSLAAAYDFSRPNQRIFPTKDRWEDTWRVGVGAEWTVWNWGATRHRIAGARASERSATENARRLREGIELEVMRTRLAILRAKSRLDLATTVVTQTTEHERSLRERYAVGTATTTQVLDAETTLERARRELSLARADRELAWASLERAVGKHLP